MEKVTWDFFLLRRSTTAEEYIRKQGIKNVEELAARLKSLGVTLPAKSVTNKLFARKKPAHKPKVPRKPRAPAKSKPKKEDKV
jgi:hypothetical protein